MTRIDAHHHLWDTARREYGWMDGPWADPLRGRFDLPLLRLHAEGHDVGMTVAVQAVHDESETRELLASGATAVVGWVDLTAHDVADRIEALRTPALKGIRHQVQDEADPQWLLRPAVQRGLHAVADAGLVYDLLVKAPQFPAAIETARAHPELSFVLDHLGKPEIGSGGWHAWADHIAELAALPNVTAKLSGLVTEADWKAWRPEQIRPYTQHALDLFGPDRLMYGSDWPVCTLAATYDQVINLAEVITAGLSKAERDAVFANTARRVYGLPPA